jgi:hypothetical protein
MEILIAAVVIGLIGYWAYTNFNKEKPDGAHVLDTLTKPVEVVPPAPVAEPVKVEAITPVAPVLDTETPVVKKPRAPAKPRAKKLPTA